MSALIDSYSSNPLLEVVERLLHLEVAFGQSPREPLAKFSLSIKDDPIIAVQKAARRIANHLGLSDLTFIVLIREQEADVAGRIHIDSSPDVVEVELSPKLLQFPAAVLATLCHEVMHKYLHRHGVKLEDKLANEKLTDTACIYLGLGIFMLDGVESDRTSYTPNGRRISSMRIGYLTPEEFALAFVLVGSMGRLSWRSRPLELQYRIRQIKSARKILRSGRLAFENGSDVHGEMLARVERRISELQRLDLRTRRLLNCCRRGGHLENVGWSQCTSRHRKLREHQIAQARLTKESNGALVYLHACRLLLQLDLITGYSKTALRSLRRNGRRSSVEASLIRCPACEQQLRIIEDLGTLNVRCPRCQYRFPVEINSRVSGHVRRLKKVLITCARLGTS